MFTDQEFEREKAKYEINTPMTKEGSLLSSNF